MATVVSFIFPTDETDTDELVNNNLQIADVLKNIELLSAAGYAWMNHFKKSYQDLEKHMRDMNFNMYIFPHPVSNLPDGFELKCPDDATNVNCIYEIHYSSRSCSECENNEFRTLKKYWNTYEESYENLKNSGYICVKNIGNMDSSDTFVFTPTYANIVNHVKNKKLILTLVSDENF